MAMDSGIIKSFGKIYNCPHELHVYGHVVHDTHPYGRHCTVAEIMKESSNIGTAQIADQVGAERQKAFLKKMGFLDPVAIELKERGRTLTPGSRWGPFETMTVGFGHGIAVTPLHLATGYATLFNGGIYRPATLLKVDRNHPVAPGRRVFTEDTSYKMRALLRLVVTQGTGRKADAPGYRVGGKTGTAEKLLNGHYTSSAVVTSFAGVFPMDEPRYVMVMMLDDPKATAETYGFHTAAWNIGPAFGVAVSRIAPMLGVRPDRNREPDMCEVLPFVHETKRRNKPSAPARPRGRRQRFRSHRLCHRPSQGRARQRVRRVQGRGVQRRRFHSAGGRARRRRGGRPARGESRRASRISPTPSRGGCSPSSPRNSTRPIPRRSSR